MSVVKMRTLRSIRDSLNVRGPLENALYEQLVNTSPRIVVSDSVTTCPILDLWSTMFWSETHKGIRSLRSGFPLSVFENEAQCTN